MRAQDDQGQSDVAILDIGLADDNSLPIVNPIHAAHANTRVIVYTLHDYAPYPEVFALKGIYKFISKASEVAAEEMLRNSPAQPGLRTKIVPK